MSYTPPTYNAINYDIVPGYIVPASTSINTDVALDDGDEIHLLSVTGNLVLRGRLSDTEPRTANINVGLSLSSGIYINTENFLQTSAALQLRSRVIATRESKFYSKVKIGLLLGTDIRVEQHHLVSIRSSFSISATSKIKSPNTLFVNSRFILRCRASARPSSRMDVYGMFAIRSSIDSIRDKPIVVNGLFNLSGRIISQSSESKECDFPTYTSRWC